MFSLVRLQNTVSPGGPPQASGMHTLLSYLPLPTASGA